MKKLILFQLFLLFSIVAFAQTITVQGKVSDVKTNETLIGASVVVKGTTNGALTDINGNFKLDNVPPNGTLTISYVGYNAQDVAVSSQKTINILLEEESATLKEVVVVGYGTQKKSDVTGAVASVKGKDIASIATPSVAQALQGKIAGVLVTPESGSPGAGAVIRIRGTGTLNNSSPFYVIDGLLSDDISFVNPNDVESVEVLKDASATAIYGSRGANGVIIVTTKRGKSGKPVIGLSSYYGSQELAKKIPLTNATEYATLRNLAAKNANSATIPYPNPSLFGEGTDWQNEIFKTAPMQNVNLSARGGNDMMTYSISGDYFKQEGILQNGDYERLTLRINNDYKLNSFIKIGHNFSIINTKSNYAPGTIYNAYYAPPTVAPIDSAGKFGNTTSDGSVGNPVATRYYERYNGGSGFRVAGNAYIDVTLFKGLTYRSNFGLDLVNSQEKAFVPLYYVTDIQKTDYNALRVKQSKNINKLWENTLSYDNTFGKHHLNLLTGVTTQIYDEYFVKGEGTNLIGDANNINGNIKDLLYLRLATAGFATTEESKGWRMFSQLYRTNYSYNDKYLLTASLRVDKSSKFGKNRRTGYFPSIGLGWRLKEEAFLKNVDWVSTLKLRGSWGKTGNDKIDQDSKSPPVTSKLDAIFGSTEKFYSGATITKLANPNLHWEETEQTDVGFEAGFLNNRFTTEIDWYKRTTYDILSALPIPGFIGASDPPVVNSASVFNQGFDINIGWRDRIKRTFGYNFNIIVSTVHNEVISLGEGKAEIFSGGVGEGGKLGTRTVIGLPIGAYYGYKVDGVFQNTEELNKYPKRVGETPNKDVFAGDLRYVDTNNDGVITDKDRTYLGSPIPDLTYTFNVGGDFKGIDFSIQISGVQGNKVMNAKRLARFSTGNFEKTFLNSWNGQGTSNFEPRVTIGGRNYEVSDRFIEDGSFTSIRNAQIGYTLPLSISNKIKMSNFRIYVAATNLKTWAKYTGYTPEVVNGGDSFSVGIDRGVYPVAKTVTVGVNVGF